MSMSGMGVGGPGGWRVLHSLTRDKSVARDSLAPGTIQRVLSYARPYRGAIAWFLTLTTIDALLVVAAPLLLKVLIDDGVIPRNRSLVVSLAIVVAVLAVVDAVLSLVQRWYSARIGEGLIFDLRREVFAHVLRQPIAFFTRTQTGALVTRLNSDVIGAQQAFTSVLQSVLSNAISLVVILIAMLSLSWQLTLGALLLIPLFLIPARLVGQRLASLTRNQMATNADMGARMSERFNVAGAQLVKIFGDLPREDREYAERAGKVRDLGVQLAVTRAIFFVSLSLVASLGTAMVYGFGGVLAIDSVLTVGTLLALTALLARLYGPLTQLSNVRVDVMTALVSFERVFELLDLPPLVAEAAHPQTIPPGPATLTVDDVRFRYPGADEISLASLESTATGDRRGSGDILRGISFTASPGQLVALVGPSGAGKTTVTSLIARFYDVSSGQISINGVDVRDASFDSLRDTVAVVTQDAHLFHETIRDNLRYAKPEATDRDLEQALRAAHIWPLIESLPEGLDTVVGDRGHRLSGGEKQRLAIARLLLKSPGLVILDEATAHLDSESEVAVQRALDAALSERTAIVVAHRLSTIRNADQILVIDGGQIVQRGRHEELLAEGGLYADLYRTQFRDQQDALTP